MAQYVSNDDKTVTLSPEEIQVMKSCMSSAIWSHSVPAAAGTYALLKVVENIKRCKYSIWVTAGSVCLSSLVARFAAIPHCGRYVMEKVPHGELAKAMRKYQAMGRSKEFEFPITHEADTPEHLPVSDYDAVSKPATPLAPVPGNQQTYDDLRRRNREEYMSKRTNQASRQSPSHSSSASEQPSLDPIYSSDSVSSAVPYYDPPSPYTDTLPVTAEEKPKYSKPKRLNKYGDEIEDS